jgi:hypothetical protein
MAAKLFAFLRRTDELDQSRIVITEIRKIQLMKDSPTLLQPLAARARPERDERLGFLFPDHVPVPLRFAAREIYGIRPDVLPNGRRVILALRVVARPDVRPGHRGCPVAEVAVVPNTWSFYQPTAGLRKYRRDE